MADGRRWGLGSRGAPVKKSTNHIGAGFRRAEGGNAGFAQKPQGRIGLGHQKGRDGFAKPGLHRASNACHGVMWAELCGRSHHGKHHIRARICRKRRQRRLHLISPRPGERHINHPPMMWQVSGNKAGHGIGIGRAGFNADNAQSIHRHSATATRGGHDRNGAARIGERLPPNEQGRRFQQRFNHGHARNSIGPEEGIRRRIRPRQRAGMAARQFGAEAGTAKLEGDDRLAQRMGAARSSGEFFRRANRFQK